MMENLLVIDDQEPIIYHKKEISANYGYTPDLDELIGMFHEDPYLIFGVDTKKSIVLIDKSGKERSISEYVELSDIRFIKIINKVLKDNNADIYIDFEFYKKQKIERSRWSDDKVMYADKWLEYPPYNNTNYVFDLTTCSMSVMENGNEMQIKMSIIDGYPVCQDIINVHTKPYMIHMGDKIYRMEKTGPSAAIYCDSLEINDNGNIYKGYLPSLYQMCIICQSMPVLDFFIKESETSIDSDKQISFQPLYGSFWTVNELDRSWAFAVAREHEQSAIRLYDKSNAKNYVLPIYRKIVK